MTNEQIYEACNYIKTHKPQKTKFETIDLAIRTVTGGECSACTKEDLVNLDDAWLIPDDERRKFAGVKGRGWAEGFTQETIKLFEDAVSYSLSQVHDIDYEIKQKLQEIRSELLNENINTNIYSNEDNKFNYK